MRQAGNITEFMEVLDEFDQTLKDPAAMWSSRTRSPDDLYKPFDPRVKVDYSPQRARRSASVTLQDLATAAEQGARTLGILQFQITRFLGENGFLCTIVLQQGDYQGRPFPAPSAVESAVTKELLRTYPSARVDLIDFDEMAGVGPVSTRRRVHLRIRRGPTVSDVK